MQFDHFQLRMLQDRDAEAFFHLIERNRPRLEDFFSGTVARTMTLSETKTYVLEILEKIDARTYLPFFIVNLHSDEFAGFLDVKNIDWRIPKAELGCFVDSAYEGKRVASQAFSMLIDHLFQDLKFNKLYLRTHADNHSAKGLAEKCGFVQEGLLRRDYKTTKGDIVDLVYYGLIPLS